jgi:hypothetical protein
VAERKREGGKYGLKDLAALVCGQLGNLFDEKKETKNASGQKRNSIPT